MTQLKCFGCHKTLGNGDTAKFIKFTQTTQLFCEPCEKKIIDFIAALYEKGK